MAVRKTSGSMLRKQPKKTAPPKPEATPKAAVPPKQEPPPKPRPLPDIACGNCKHWEAPRLSPIVPMSQGNCHRNPPPFPVIRADGFCGEFARK